MSNVKRLTMVVVLASLAATMIFLAFPAAANAQIRPALVRSVDEPARVPYYVSAQATCPFTNVCWLNGTAVPAGKRLRVTQISGVIRNQSTSVIAYLSLNVDTDPLVMYQYSPFNMAYFGTGVSFSQAVDFYFEAGQIPVLAFGTPAGQTTSVANKLTITGYLVDILP